MLPAQKFSSISRKVFWLNYLFISVIFLLNFLGTPQLKELSLVYAGFVLLCAFSLDLKNSFPIIVSFCFMEGQARILWNYHPFFRIAFDLTIAVAMLRHFAVARVASSKKILPRPLMVLILLHFLWYVVEIFNINSVSMLAPIVATKIYIFPFFLFLLIRRDPEVVSIERLQTIGHLILFFTLLECSLSLFQLKHLESFMLSISPFYERAMKGKIFTGVSFRPFGTTFLPGAISVYIFLSTGFLFLKNKFSKKYSTILMIISVLVFLTLLVCQVRSAMIKYVFLVLASLFALVLNSRVKFVKLFQTSIIFIAVALGVFNLATPDEKKDEGPVVNIDSGLKRWEGIDSMEKLSSKRLGPEAALGVLVKQLGEFPIGVGPGLTGAASSISAESIANDPIYNSDMYWAYDNFYLSMFIEFGYGAIFYLSFVLGIPLVIFSYYRRLRRRGYPVHSRIILISFSHLLVILLGNWGAIGLPYNPESFFFWVWAAVGFNIYDEAMMLPDLAQAPA